MRRSVPERAKRSPIGLDSQPRRFHLQLFRCADETHRMGDYRTVVALVDALAEGIAV